jgi:V-type H+-transporting ATPase subunit H
MINVVQAHSREKIWRVAFFTFRNLANTSELTIEIMVDCGLLKAIDTLLKGNIKDTELKEDLEYMGGLLEKNLKILTYQQ